jgi:tetratricopeptide (TPR) repeat protein
MVVLEAIGIVRVCSRYVECKVKKMPNSKNTYDIFVSYSHDDKEWVRRHLYEPLLQCQTTDGNQVRVFLDEVNIPPGAEWIEALSDGIQNSRFHIAVYSESYFASKMCKRELALFFEDPFAGETLYPVLLRPEDKDMIPFYARPRQYQTVQAPDWFDRLTSSLDIATQSGTRHALAVGISQYQDNSIPNLKFAAQDAQDFSRLLIDEGRFPETQVHVLTDGDASLRNIRRAFTDLRRNTEPDDLIAIYFAGHGSPDTYGIGSSGNSEMTWKYLVPADAERDYLEDTAFPLTALQKNFDDYVAEHVVVFLDSCYSGSDEEDGRGFSDVGARAVMSDVMLDDLASEKGRAILAACEANELAYEHEDLGHGLFTHFLLKGLAGEASPTGHGPVNVAHLYDYLTVHVPLEAKKQGKRQRPVLKGDRGLRLPITFPRSSVPSLQPDPPPDPDPPEDRSPFEEAKALYDEGKYDEAIELLDELVSKPGPTLVAELGVLGDCHALRGDHQSALETFRKAIDVDPTDPIGHAGSGKALLKLEDYNAAIDAYRNTVQIDEHYKSRYFEVQTALEGEIKLRPMDHEILWPLARIYVLRGMGRLGFRRAMEAISNWPEEDLDTLEQHLLQDIAVFQQEEGFVLRDMEKEINSRQEAHKAFEEMSEQARLALADADLAAARRILENCQDLNTEAPVVLEMLGEVKERSQKVLDCLTNARARFAVLDYGGAQDALSEGFGFDKTDVESLSLKKEIEEAVEMANRASDLYNAALADEAGGNVDSACEKLAEAILLFPENPDIKDALERLSAQLKEQKAYDGFILEARQHENEGRLSKARNSLLEGLNKFPDDEAMKSRLQEVEQKITASIKKTFRDLLRKSDLLVGERKYDEARSALEEANALIPDHRNVNKRLKKLEPLPAKYGKFRGLLAQADAHEEIGSSGSLTMAIELINEALKLFPEEKWLEKKKSELNVAKLEAFASEQKELARQKKGEDNEVWEQRNAEKFAEVVEQERERLNAIVIDAALKAEEEEKRKEALKKPKKKKRNLRPAKQIRAVGEFRQIAGKGAEKWGYVDADRPSDFIIPPQFDVARKFSEGLAAVKKGRGCGYIDETGKVVIDFQFKEAGDFWKGRAKIKTMFRRTYYINIEGKECLDQSD